jgi:predicted MFS family arabinose efflux permease
MISTLFWGKFFDKQNLAITKILINGCILVSIATFFFTEHYWLLILSIILMELGHSGHLIVWQLWVTKIAPSPDKLATYVSIDVAIKGFRDALSVGLGYFLLSCSISLHTICIIATILAVISTVCFCFIVKHPRLK